VGERRKPRRLPSAAAVRVATMLLLIVVFVVLVVSMGRNRHDPDSLSYYWITLSPEQQDATCSTYMAYPDFASNSLVGLLHYKVSAKEARTFLWSNCG
jgi:hypothetical protein